MPRVKQILVTREEKIFKDEPKNELEFKDDENQQEEEEFFKNEPNSREKHDKNDEIPKGTIYLMLVMEREDVTEKLPVYHQYFHTG